MHEEIARRILSKKTASDVEGGGRGGAMTLQAAALKRNKKPKETAVLSIQGRPKNRSATV